MAGGAQNPTKHTAIYPPLPLNNNSADVTTPDDNGANKHIMNQKENDNKCNSNRNTTTTSKA